MKTLKRIIGFVFNFIFAGVALCAVILLVFALFGFDPRVLVSSIEGNNMYAQVLGDIAHNFESNAGLTGPKITPRDGEDIKPATIEFVFEERTFSVTGVVDKSIYYGALNSPRSYTAAFYKSEQEKQAAYMSAFVNDPEQKPALDALCKGFRSVKKKHSFSRDEYAEFITKYVQSIPYDVERASAGLLDKTLKGDPRFPVQTIVDGKADCDEKVYLLAALLGHEGFGTAGFLYTPEKHMCLGIKSAGPGYQGSGYEIVETTSPMYISEVPKEFAGGVQLTSKPDVIELTAGEKVYSESAVKDVKYVIHARETALASAPSMKAKAEAANNEQTFNHYKKMYKDCYEAYNTLQSTVDENGEHTSDFKDRDTAISWLRGHGWWVK